MRSKYKVFISCLILGLILTNFASAAIVNCGGRNAEGTTQAPCKIGELIGTVKVLISTLLSWAWLVSIIFIVWSGFQMVMSRGNEEAVTLAKTSLSHAILGFIIILLSFVIVNFVVVFLTGGQFNFDKLINSFNLVP